MRGDAISGLLSDAENTGERLFYRRPIADRRDLYGGETSRDAGARPGVESSARWDAFIGTDDPDALYTEFVGREVSIHRELANTSDGLRAFEITDNSGYVLCFGRPVDR